MRRIVTAITAAALAFGMLAQTAQVAAVSGYDSAYSGESAFVDLAPGQSNDFQVFFANVGTTTWSKGTSSQVDLAACKGDKTTCNAGPDASDAAFNPTAISSTATNGWLSTTRYASQTQSTVAPGAVATFKYTVTAPATAAAGLYLFNGALVLSATGEDIHNEGYFQQVNLKVTVTIAIASTTPASPSNNQTPVVNVTGAGNAQTVRIFDGTTGVGTGTSAADGTVAITTTSLAEGSHSLTAQTGNQTSPVSTYADDLTKPKVSSANAVALTLVDVTFNENMNCTNLGTANYSVNDTAGNQINATTPIGGGASTVSASGTPTATGATTCLIVRLTLTNALTNGTAYRVTVNSGATDTAGNGTDPANNNTGFTAADVTPPTLVSAVYRSTSVVRFTYSEPMNALSTGVGSRNVANYTFDGTSGTAAFSSCGTSTASSTTADCTLSSGTFTLASHTFTVSSVTDTAGNTINPSPTTTSIIFPPTLNRPTVTAVASTNLTQITVTFSTRMSTATNAGPPAVVAANSCGTGNYVITKSDGTSSGVTCASVTTLNGASASIFLIAVTPAMTAGSFNLTTSNVTDPFGNIISPNPTVTAFTTVADTVAPTVSSTSVPVTTTNPCPIADANGTSAGPGPCNQTMFSVNFSEPMGVTTIENVANFTLTNSQGISLATCKAGTSDGSTAAFAAAAAQNAKTTVCVLTPTPIQSGTYTLTIGTGVLDISGNAIAASTTINVVFADTTRPIGAISAVNTTTSGASASGTASTLFVNFTNSQTTGATSPDFMSQAGGGAGTNSVLNFANFKVDGVTLTSTNTTSIACVNTSAATGSATILCNQIKITFPANTMIAAGAHSLTITNAMDTGGNLINPNPQTIAFTSA